MRVFIDYWNFQLMWNERAGSARCDWKSLPGELTRAADSLLTKVGLDAVVLQETRVYAGYEAGREASLKNWLSNFLDRQPGFRVFTSERHWRAHPVHCRSCGVSTNACPSCSAAFGRAAEKTIDARIVTDLIGLAWEGAYKAAVLVSSDKDFIPAVDYLQSKNIHVINATWQGRGHELAKVCWASFELDPYIAALTRTVSAP
jgi:uncharacterized LabA/DUF88 family protein